MSCWRDKTVGMHNTDVTYTSVEESRMSKYLQMCTLNSTHMLTHTHTLTHLNTHTITYTLKHALKYTLIH